MRTRRKNNILALLMALLMMSAMMPMTAGTVFAESDTDTEAPVIDLESLTVTLPEGKDKVTAGDSVTFSVNISDDREVQSAYIYFRTPVSGKEPRVELSYGGDDPTGNGVWTGEFTVTDESENGIWKVLYVQAGDAAGNVNVLYNSNAVTWGSADLSGCDFEVYGTDSDPDISAPVIDLESLTMTLPEGKDKVTAGDSVTFSVNISDDREVQSAYIYFRTPVSGKEPRVELSYGGDDPTGNGVWTGEFTVTDESENGIWQVLYVQAGDTAGNVNVLYNSNAVTWGSADLSACDFEVVAPDCPFDLTTSGYSMMLDGEGATTTSGGNYYVESADENVTPTVKVRFDAGDGTWTTLAPRKYTLKYEKKTGEKSWEEYTADTFGVDEDGTATYRVSATGKESLYYTGTVGPVEFNVIKKCKVTFDTRSGSSIDPQYILPGEKAAKPSNPTRDGWYFSGYWYTDETLTTEYNFNNPVKEDITLYAEWYTNMAVGVYSLSDPADRRCGTIDIETSMPEVCYQDVRTINFTAPEGSVKFTAKPAEGYIFKGWYGGVIGSSYFVETPSDELLSEETEYTCDAGEAAICAVFEKVDIDLPVCDHVWDSGTVTRKASATKAGEKVFTCTVCGETKTEVIPKVAAPTGKVTILNTVANSAKKTNDVIWDKSKVKGATGYIIEWRARGTSKWASRKVGNVTRGVTSGLTIGNLYEIRVTPYKPATAATAEVIGTPSDIVYRYFFTTQKIRLASKSKGTFTMSWAKDPKATSYQVLYTTNSNGAGAAQNIKTAGASATSITVKDIKVNGKVQKLKSGTTYYVQVREVRTVGGKNYIGNISITVAVKVK